MATPAAGEILSLSATALMWRQFKHDEIFKGAFMPTLLSQDTLTFQFGPIWFGQFEKMHKIF